MRSTSHLFFKLLFLYSLILNTMSRKIHTFLFNNLSLKNYLRILQGSYFTLYNTGVLRLSPNYDLHYYVKNLINKGDTVIDIGANLGYYSFLFAKWIGNSGHLYAVEPIQIYNEVYNLKAKKFNNITLLPYALGNKNKEIEMVLPTKEEYLRTGLPHVYEESRDGNLEDIKFRFKAKMRKPSELFRDIPKIDYIKCDVEGFEYNVLSEMKDVINKHKPKVQVEVWGNNKEQILQLFEDMNYKAYFLNTKKELELVANNNKTKGDFIFIHNS